MSWTRCILSPLFEPEPPLVAMEWTTDGEERAHFRTANLVGSKGEWKTLRQNLSDTVWIRRILLCALRKSTVTDVAYL
jgi:hypothetical protein